MNLYLIPEVGCQGLQQLNCGAPLLLLLQQIQI